MKRLLLSLIAVVVATVAAVQIVPTMTATGSAGAAPVIPSTPWHTDVACGVPTEVIVPEDTDDVTYEGFTTTYGYYKVVATLTDHSRTFTLDGTGYTSTDVAPYRAEHLTLLVEPCRDSSPAEPVQPAPTEAPASGGPAPAPQPKPGCYP